MPDEFTNYIYITTPRNSNKMAEIEANPHVPFTTEPTDDDNRVVTSNKAQIHLTDKAIDDVLPLLNNQIPEWTEVVCGAKKTFVVWKLEFEWIKFFGNQGINSVLIDNQGVAKEEV